MINLRRLSATVVILLLWTTCAVTADAQCVGGRCFPGTVYAPVTTYQPMQFQGVMTRPYIWQGPIATALRGGYRHYSVPIYGPAMPQQSALPNRSTTAPIPARQFYYFRR